MKRIPLTQGQVAFVDDSDYEMTLSNGPWYASKSRCKWYAYHSLDASHKLMMHRLIMGLNDQELTVDHIDGNGLNNQRSNLRVTTHSQNVASQGLSKSNTTGYKGVSRFRGNRYQASIKVNYIQKFLGYFDTAEEAADAYDQAAIEHFGQFAKTNKMLEQNRGR